MSAYTNGELALLIQNLPVSSSESNCSTSWSAASPHRQLQSRGADGPSAAPRIGSTHPSIERDEGAKRAQWVNVKELADTPLNFSVAGDINSPPFNGIAHINTEYINLHLKHIV